MKKTRFLLLLLPLLLPSFRTEARTGFVTRDILLVCSHAESSDWAQDMISPVTLLEEERSDIHVYSSFLRMTSLSGVEDLEVRKQEIFDAFPEHGPALAILIGGSGYILAEDIQDRWPGTPVILAGENDYYCDTEYTIQGGADPDAARYPVSGLLDRGVNLTLLHTPAMVEQTVDLMCTLQPGMRKFLFIAGENFQCREQQVRLERYLDSMHARLDYEPVYSHEYSTDELISKLQGEDRATTGILFGSWLTHQGYMETISSRHNVTHIIEAIAPVFTLFWCDLEKNRLITGYDSYDHDRYHEELRSRILAVLDGGEQPRNMPFLRFTSGRPTVNWTSLQKFGMDPSLIPAGADVYARPKTLWEAYGRALTILLFGILLAFLAVVFLLMRHSLSIQKKAKEEAQKASSMKTLFIQNMNHEIRTPMNAIIGFAQLLGLPDGLITEEEKAEYLSYVMNNSHLLIMLIGDILSLSDMEKGVYTINIAPCNLNEMCRLALKSADHRAQPGVVMEFESGLPEDLRVSTDGMRVQQILINYLTNACKHTQQGSIRLESSLTENPGYVTFSVTDTGTGVPPEKAEEIFGRFVKLNDFVQGTGLGLSICRLLAGELDGRVWLDTGYTGGARFLFTIPCREA